MGIWQKATWSFPSKPDPLLTGMSASTWAPGRASSGHRVCRGPTCSIHHTILIVCMTVFPVWCISSIFLHVICHLSPPTGMETPGEEGFCLLCGFIPCTCCNSLWHVEGQGDALLKEQIDEQGRVSSRATPQVQNSAPPPPPRSMPVASTTCMEE